jgi:hypothetical protein
MICSICRRRINVNESDLDPMTARAISVRLQRSAARIRQRAHRARERQGKITLPVDVDEVALACALVDAGLIAVDEQEDRRKLAAALSRMVEIILTADLPVVASRVTSQHL